MVNALLFVALIRRRKQIGSKVLGVFAVCAVVAVGLFVPWIVALLGQIGWVSSNFWIEYEFPETELQLAFYLALTQAISDSFEGICGQPWQVLVIVLILAAVVCVALLTAALVCRTKSGDISLIHDASTPRLANPCVCALAAYAGVFLIALLAGIALNQMVLYYRYLYVGSAFIIFAFAWFLVQAGSKRIVAFSAVVTLCFAGVHQFLTFNSYYYGENFFVLSGYEEMVAETEAANGGDTLVVSSDIGIAGVLASQVPDVEITYLDVYNTAAAYEAYAPTIEIVDEWDELLANYEGQFVVLMTDCDYTAFESFAQEHNATVVEVQTYYHSYEDMDYCLAILEK